MMQQRESTRSHPSSSATAAFVLGHESLESSDWEQCKLRIVLSSLAVAWSTIHRLPIPPSSETLEPHSMVAMTYLVLSLVLTALWYVVHYRQPSLAPTFRNICLVADITAISIYTAVSDAAAIILLPIYLSAIIGYGMRFGHRHLIGALVLSVVEFILVSGENSYLRSNITIRLTYLLSMSFVPIYTILLLKKYEIVLEAYIEASRQKEEFIAIMSHEFRAPLHSIISVAELCQSHLRGPDGNQASAHLLSVRVKDILRCSERMLSIANRIAIQQSEKTPTGQSGRPASNTYRDVFLAIRICDIYAKRKNLELSWEISGGTPPFTDLDSSVLQEILINLLDNAIKYTSEGWIRLDVRINRPVRREPMLELVVADTGRGISVSPPTNSREPDGHITSLISRQNAGLGLAISKRHVERLGGSLEYAENNPNGTRVIVNLPLSTPSEAVDMPTPWLRILIFATRPLSVAEETILIACRLFPRYVLGGGALRAESRGKLESFSATFSDQPGRFDDSSCITNIRDFSAIPNVLFVTSSLPQYDSSSRFRPNFSIVVDDPSVAVQQLSAFRMLAQEHFPLHAERNPLRSGNATVLLVDDSEITLEATQRVLENSGFRCHVALSTDIATVISRTFKIDVVVADLYVGEENFLEYYEVAKTEFLSSVPVIVVTAETDTKILAKAREIGAYEVITKPVSASNLLGCIFRARDEFTRQDSPHNRSPGDDRVVDWRVLDEICETATDYSSFVQQVRRFEDDLLGDAIRALRLTKIGDYPSLCRLFHKMNGVAMLFGARQISECLSGFILAVRSESLSSSALTEIEDFDLLVDDFVAACISRHEPVRLGPSIFSQL